MKERCEGNTLEQLQPEILQALQELQSAVKKRNESSNTTIAMLKQKLEVMEQKCKEAVLHSVNARDLLDQIMPELETLLKEIEKT